MTRPDEGPPKPPGLAGPILVGVALAGLGLGGFLWWAATAPLSSAAIAPGVVVVESARRAIQHYEGGIAAQLFVREGQAVAAGQVLLRVANGAEAARLEQLTVRETALLAERARLMAELAGDGEIAFPDALRLPQASHRAAQAMAVQRQLFEARRAGRAQSEAIAASARVQADADRRGYEAQIAARRAERGFLRARIAGLERIAERGFAPGVQIDDLRARLARLEGDLAQLATAQAAARARMDQAGQDLARIRTGTVAEVAERLQDVARELAEVREARLAAQDVIRRADVVSPTDGRVLGLAVSAPGGVIRSGETLMEIVPEEDGLRIEAQIDPRDIDVIHGGQPVQVRLTAYSFRHTQPLPGHLDQISADRIVDPRSGAVTYKAIVRLDEEAMGDRAGEGITLYPGMAAEVVIGTGERTLLDYLLDPILKSLSRALRET